MKHPDQDDDDHLDDAREYSTCTIKHLMPYDELADFDPDDYEDILEHCRRIKLT